MLFKITRTLPAFPRLYKTYYQEIEQPYRRAEPVTVVRMGSYGLVLGRWTSRAPDEGQALTDALQAREVPLHDIIKDKPCPDPGSDDAGPRTTPPPGTNTGNEPSPALPASPTDPSPNGEPASADTECACSNTNPAQKTRWTKSTNSKPPAPASSP